MNSKEALKIQTVINILDHDKDEIFAAGEITTESIFNYWDKLNSTAILLEEILEDTKRGVK